VNRCDDVVLRWRCGALIGDVSLPLAHDSALIIYSDFDYPDAEGRHRKTILVRRIDTKIS